MDNIEIEVDDSNLDHYDSSSSFSSCNSLEMDAFTISCSEINPTATTATTGRKGPIIQSDSFRRQKQQIISYEKGDRDTHLRPSRQIHMTTPRSARLDTESNFKSKSRCDSKSSDTKMHYLGAPATTHYNISSSSITASINTSTKSLYSQNSTSVGSNFYEMKSEEREPTEPSMSSTVLSCPVVCSIAELSPMYSESSANETPSWNITQHSAPAKYIRSQSVAEHSLIQSNTRKRDSHYLNSTHSLINGHDRNSLRNSIKMGPRQITVTEKARTMIFRKNCYINQYLIQDKLGSGNFGLVKKCKDITTGITYAMKILRKDNLRQQVKFKWANNIIRQSSALDDVQEEIAIMKKLQHPNIVNLVEVINSEKVLYLILEYMIFGSLAKSEVKIKKVVRDEREFKTHDTEVLRHYARDMISGLAYLHSQRICHSDIKPENILIGEGGVLKLADFGLSKFLSQGESRSVFNQKDGTPAFQAPECLDDNDRKFSLYPTDVWALGVTLYQIKYGILPFFAEDDEKLADMIINEPLKIPEETEDKDFADLLHGMLTKDPTKRSTMKELCVHPWITDRKRLNGLIGSYARESVTEKESQKAVSELVKFDTFNENDDSKTRNRGLTSWQTEVGGSMDDMPDLEYTSSTLRTIKNPLKTIESGRISTDEPTDHSIGADKDTRPSLVSTDLEAEIIQPSISRDSSIEKIVGKDMDIREDIRELSDSRTKPTVLPRARTTFRPQNLGLGPRFGHVKKSSGLRKRIEMKDNLNQENGNVPVVSVLNAVKVKGRRTGSRIKFVKKARIVTRGSKPPQKSNSGLKRKSILKSGKKK